MSALDKVLLAADLLEPIALGDDDLAEAHEHLMKECPWYTAVSDGGSPGDPRDHGSVKLTPRTPEASTVVQPTVPPGGPGLFHMKGHHLPPYVEHLYKHLVKRYGKHKAYGVAIGIVKKWAKGINPGGWKTRSGKGKRTHADVRAAAARNVAEWEKEKAEAHRHGGHVKATAALSAAPEHPTLTKPEAHYRAGGTPGHQCGDCSMSRDWRAPDFESGDCTLVKGLIEYDHVCDHYKAKKGAKQDSKVKLAASFPGDKDIPLPPVPHDKTAVSMFTAHRLGDIINQMSHASERVTAAAKAPKNLREYHAIHICNHLTNATRSGHQLVENMRRNYPSEARELDRLNAVIGVRLSVSTTPSARTASFAHLVQTIMYNLGHAKRHADAMRSDQPGNDKAWRFNLDHAARHVAGAIEHADKLAEHLRDNYPAEAHWLKVLESFQGGKSGSYGRPEGTAAREIKKNENLQLAGQAQSVWSAPGAKPIIDAKSDPDTGLKREHPATGGPKTPTGPRGKLPTPEDIRGIIKLVPDCSDASLSRSARKHLEDAAVKMAKGETLTALHSLRSVQSDVYSAHKVDLGSVGPAVYTANVFAKTALDKTVPPAEKSSANTAMLQGQDRRMQWRKVEQAVALAIDQIRRWWYHGLYDNISQQARF